MSKPGKLEIIGGVFFLTSKSRCRDGINKKNSETSKRRTFSS